MTEHKNTNETSQLRQTAVKCRFFAQYWGVKCFQWNSENSVGLQIDKVNYQIDKYYNCGFLSLKPLSKITDEEKNILEESIIGFVSDIFNIGCFTYINVLSSIFDKTIPVELNSYHIDFLRSKGYAVPFMEYSVDDLVSFGWVRLS